MLRKLRLQRFIGEKFGPGGELVWDGIRGGAREIAYLNGATFWIEAAVEIGVIEATYFIEVRVDNHGAPPRVKQEWLRQGSVDQFTASLFDEQDFLHVKVTGHPRTLMPLAKPARGR